MMINNITSSALLPVLLLSLLSSSSSLSSPSKSNGHQHERQQQQNYVINQPGDLFDERQAFQFAQASSKYEMRCAFENSIEPLNAAKEIDDITIARYKQQLINGVNVTWLRYFDKRTTPDRIHRINGEQIDGLSDDFRDKPRITLHEVGSSDAGYYECRLKWPDIHVIRYFRLPAKITFPLIVKEHTDSSSFPHNHLHQKKLKSIKSANQNKPNALASQEFNIPHITLGQFISTICAVAFFIVICVTMSIYYGFKFCQTPLHEKNFSNLQTNIPYNKGITDQEQGQYQQLQGQYQQSQGQYQQLKAAFTPSPDHCRQLLAENACVSNPAYAGLYAIPNESCALKPLQERPLLKCDQIGGGQFGMVFRYKWMLKDGTCGGIVAVKELSDSKKADIESGRDELLNEIDLLKSINDHPNVIKVIGCILTDNENPKLVMEYAELGDLQRYLRDCRNKHSHDANNKCDQNSCQDENHSACRNVTSRELIKFARDIARGMAYVASCGIIHRDLASRNILLTADRICKISDFGFARCLKSNTEYERKTSTVVPVKWMAPEALMNRFTTKSDVFSFGIVLWEIVTLGATPYKEWSTTEVYQNVTEGKRMSKPNHCKDELWSIMERSWLQEPKNRPTFEELACELNQLLPSKNDYIELDQYNTQANYYNILEISERQEVKL